MIMRSSLLILIALLTLGGQSARSEAMLETPAKQAIIIDYDTGTVLYEKNADERMPTSSMSKVLTIYLVFEALKEGHLRLDDTLMISENAWRMQGSKMFVEIGNKIKVEDLIRGVIIQSGNDATIALAEGIAGTESLFAERLNAKAQQLGMTQSHFMNASGWPDPEHYSTARDLATLARALIHDFPEYYKYYSEKEFVYHGIKQGNRNPLLYDNAGGDGIKTGHTEDAGYGLIGSGTEGGRRVILVVNGLTSMKERAQEGSKLLQWGLKRFENKKLFAANQAIENIPVALGQKNTVAAGADQDMLITLPRAVNADIKITAEYNAPLKAPVHKGDRLGVLKVQMPDAPVREIPLLALEDVPALGFFSKTFAKIGLALLPSKTATE